MISYLLQFCNEIVNELIVNDNTIIVMLVYCAGFDRFSGDRVFVDKTMEFIYNVYEQRRT